MQSHLPEIGMGGERCEFELKSSWGIDRLRHLAIRHGLCPGSVQRLKDLNGSLPFDSLRNSDEVPVDGRYKPSRLRASSRSDTAKRTEMIGVDLLEDIDRAPADGVEPLSGDIELHVVNSLVDGQSLELFASVAVEHHNLAASASHEQPLVLFIKSHGDVVW
jgi:hypothetical protein